MLALLERSIVLVNGLVDLGVLVRRNDERLALVGEDRACAFHVGVNQSCNLEARTKLVLKTEGVAGASAVDGTSDSLPRTLSRAEHDVLYR